MAYILFCGFQEIADNLDVANNARVAAPRLGVWLTTHVWLSHVLTTMPRLAARTPS